MSEPEFGPLGTAALRSSVALDARGYDWAVHAVQSSQAPDDSSSQATESTRPSAAFHSRSSGTAKAARHWSTLPDPPSGWQGHAAVEEPTPPSKFRFCPSPSKVKEAQPVRLPSSAPIPDAQVAQQPRANEPQVPAVARLQAADSLPGSPTIAAHRSPTPGYRSMSHSVVRVPRQSPPPPSQQKASPAHAQPDSPLQQQQAKQEWKVAAPAGPVPAPAAPLSHDEIKLTPAVGQKEGEGRGDDVSLWGSSTWDERNAASEPGDPLASHHSDPHTGLSQRSSGLSPSPTPGDRQKAISPSSLQHTPGQLTISTPDPGAPSSGARTPKRTFLNMLTGQGPAQQWAAQWLSPPMGLAAGTSQSPKQLHAVQKQDQQALAASHATIDWLRDSAAAAEHSHQGDEDHEDDASGDFSADVSTPDSSAPLSLPSPDTAARRSPVPLLRLGGISNLEQAESGQHVGSNKLGGGGPVLAAKPVPPVPDPCGPRPGAQGAGDQAQRHQHQNSPQPHRRRKPRDDLYRHSMPRQRIKRQLHSPGLDPEAAEEQGNEGGPCRPSDMQWLQTASMAQLAHSLNDSPMKPAARHDRGTHGKSPDQEQQSARLLSNPLYGEGGGPDMATPDSMLGSHSASNEIYMPSGATLKSVSGRPMSNPLFETQDDASRYEGKVIHFAEQSGSEGAPSPPSRLSSLSSPSLSQLMLNGDRTAGPVPTAVPACVSAGSPTSPRQCQKPDPTTTPDATQDLPQPAQVTGQGRARKGGKPGRGFVSRLTPWGSKAAKESGTAAAEGREGKSGARPRLLSCFVGSVVADDADGRQVV